MPLLDYLPVRMAEGVVAWPRKISRKPSGISPSLSRCLHAPRTDLGTSRPSLLLQTRQRGHLFSVNIFSRPQERVTRRATTYTARTATVSRAWVLLRAGQAAPD